MAPPLIPPPYSEGTHQPLSVESAPEAVSHTRCWLQLQKTLVPGRCLVLHEQKSCEYHCASQLHRVHLCTLYILCTCVPPTSCVPPHPVYLCTQAPLHITVLQTLDSAPEKLSRWQSVTLGHPSLIPCVFFFSVLLT